VTALPAPGLTVIVCGGRDFSDLNRVWRGLDHFEEQYGSIGKLVHGGATGADALAAEWGERSSAKVVSVPAAWRKYGKRAGPIRNQRMLDEHRPNYVIAFEGGKGTADMCARAVAAGVEVVRL
jgi:hypothetical protein